MSEEAKKVAIVAEVAEEIGHCVNIDPDAPDWQFLVHNPFGLKPDELKEGVSERFVEEGFPLDDVDSAIEQADELFSPDLEEGTERFRIVEEWTFGNNPI